jgi:hypothetical protein
MYTRGKRAAEEPSGGGAPQMQGQAVAPQPAHGGGMLGVPGAVPQMGGQHAGHAAANPVLAQMLSNFAILQQQGHQPMGDQQQFAMAALLMAQQQKQQEQQDAAQRAQQLQQAVQAAQQQRAQQALMQPAPLGMGPNMGAYLAAAEKVNEAGNQYVLADNFLFVGACAVCGGSRAGDQGRTSDGGPS